MSAIEIKKVESRRDLCKFIDFHNELYKGNPYHVPNLYFDEMNTFRKDKNAAFDFCEAEYFMAYRDGKVVGRVAAIINHSANKKWERESVRFGWIDFVDDIEVSKALLKAVEDYGKSKGMKEIVGPLGFTDMDPEGMLLYGYDQLGTQATAYNYPYYPEHMDRMGGWEKDNDYVEYKLYVPEEMPEKYATIAKMIQKRYNLQVKKLKRNEIYGENGYGRKIFQVVNETFKDLYGYSKLTDRQIEQYVKMYLPMADLDLITIIEDWNTPDHKVVGVGISIPSLARALQKCGGKLFPFGWWHILRALKFHKTEVVDLLLVGVLPEYRQKGANALLFYDLIPHYQRLGFKWGETHVEMETNMKVQGQWQYLNREIHKRRRCYKKDI
ncbi:N-acetyltransferase [Leyella stercorea]|jgi:GNAT superfamily N-acetyltransferase|uniref:N-acetyltransferase n=1 Tax=Leyella stercorea TaxID=363265 RepID=UPI000ECBED26|nr:N-acetyltransferase [Leyella stercorea]MBD8938237.1 N-acetyltransferase [Leyella stercorea]HAH76396.1 N-acetyltransferase [Leyella stercorea]